jgi:hypothetical protein
LKASRWEGARVNLLTDVWKNISKRHLMGNLLSFGEITTFDVQAVSSRHDAIATAIDLEGVMNRVIDKGWNLGAVVTDDAGQCRKARKILARRSPSVVFLFCFAHCVNNLVKQVLKTAFAKIARDASIIVNIFNASSAKWLVLAREAMHDHYSMSRAFITLCEVRWNSMQGCFASLLRAKSALIAFHRQHKNMPKYPKKFRLLGKTRFWRRLQEAEQTVRPLSRASYRLQRDENSLADVVRSFADIFTGFLSAPRYRKKLIACVESRWSDCEQPLFLLAYFLHPKYVKHTSKLIAQKIISPSVLSNIAVYYYRRFFKTESVGSLREQFEDWIAGFLTHAKLSEWSTDSIARFWNHVRGEGSPEIAKLATAVLSIAVNTASCERLFSEFGAIHTALRNRLGRDKVRRIHVIRKAIRKRYGRAKAVEKKIVDPREPHEQTNTTLTPSRHLRMTPERQRREPAHTSLPTLPQSEPAPVVDEQEGQLLDGDEDLIREDVANDFEFMNLVLDEILDPGMEADIDADMVAEREAEMGVNAFPDRPAEEVLDSDDEYDHDEVAETDTAPVAPMINIPAPRLNQDEIIPAPVQGPILENARGEVLTGLRSWKISLAALFQLCPASPNNEIDGVDRI